MNHDDVEVIVRWQDLVDLVAYIRLLAFRRGPVEHLLHQLNDDHRTRLTTILAAEGTEDATTAYLLEVEAGT